MRQCELIIEVQLNGTSALSAVAAVEATRAGPWRACCRSPGDAGDLDVRVAAVGATRGDLEARPAPSHGNVDNWRTGIFVILVSVENF